MYFIRYRVLEYVLMCENIFMAMQGGCVVTCMNL